MPKLTVRICSTCGQFRTQHPSGVCSSCRRKERQSKAKNTNAIVLKHLMRESTCPLCGNCSYHKTTYNM